MNEQRIICPACGKPVKLRPNGRIPHHGHRCGVGVFGGCPTSGSALTTPEKWKDYGQKWANTLGRPFHGFKPEVAA